MKKSLLLLLFCSLFSLTWAGGGNIKKYLKMLPMGRGMLYFVKPVDLPTSPKGVSLNADFTYPFFKDSVQPYMTMNFTLMTDSGIVKFKQLNVVQGGKTTFSTDSLERFFSEPAGKQWTNRYSVNIKLTDMLAYFKNAANGNLELIYDNKKLVVTLPKKLRKSYSLIAQTIEIGCQGGF